MTPAHRCLLALATAFSLTSVAQAQDAALGRKKADTCFGCHGIVGYQASFPQIYKVPKLSGQNTEYLVSALTAYKKGERKHPTMQAVAGALSEKDIADLAAFFHQYGQSSIKPVAETVPPPPSPEVAALVTKGVCSSCHGANFSKPIAPNYPKIAGQYPDYLYAALKAYASDGSNPSIGRGNAIMAAQAKQFNHEQLQALAQYVGSLPSELLTVPNPRFR